MFSHLTKRLRSEVEIVKRVLASNNLLRESAYALTSTKQTEEAAGSDVESHAQHSFHVQVLPQKTEWQIFDYCAALTRLYAAYEQFITDLASDYLNALPDLYRTYADLPPAIQNQHRVGIGQMLVKLGVGQYREIEEQAIVTKLAEALKGTHKYTFVQEAFLVDRQNYRFSMIVKILSSLGVEDAQTAVLNNRLLAEFIRSRRGDNGSVAKELDDFIDFRNEVAHTRVENILSVDELNGIGDFIIHLGECLNDILTMQTVRRKIALRQYQSIGVVTESHYSGRVLVIKCRPIRLSVSDQVVVQRKDDMFLAAIESIQINSVDVNMVDAADGQEIGIRLSRKAKQASAIRRLLLPNAPAAVDEAAPSVQSELFKPGTTPTEAIESIPTYEEGDEVVDASGEAEPVAPDDFPSESE